MSRPHLCHKEKEKRRKENNPGSPFGVGDEIFSVAQLR